MNIMLIHVGKVINSKGGGEKVFCNMANEFTRRGHQVMAVCCEKDHGVEQRPFYPLNNDVEFYNLGFCMNDVHILDTIKREFIRIFNKERACLYRWIQEEKLLEDAFRKFLKKKNVDILICFDPKATRILKKIVLNSTPTVTMIHFSPDHLSEFMLKSQWEELNKSDCVQVLMKSYINDLTQYCQPKKIVAIPNSVPQFSENVYLSKKSKYKIITMGRLDKREKQPHMLIEAFQKIKNKFPSWEVEFWGDSEDKSYFEELKLMIFKYNLEDRMCFKGVTNNILDVLRDADLFVLPSSTEGFGLALAEAMSFGLPAIGYKSCSAVNELIKDGYNGFLCEDGVEDMAMKMGKLMENFELRKMMGRNAHLSMKQYKDEDIWDQWEKLIFEVTKQNDVRII